MYSKKSQSELIENKDYNMVLLLPHNATKIKYFSKSFSIRFFLLVIKEYYVFLKVTANVSAAEPVLMGVDACYGSVALLAGCFIYFSLTSISLTLSKNTRQLGCLSFSANDRSFLLLDRYFIF